MGKKHTFAALAAASAIFAGAPAVVSAAEPSPGLKDAYDTVYQRVERAGGEPGRNIAKDGVREDGAPRSATRAEVLDSLGVLRRMHLSLKPGSATAQASATGSAATAATSSGTSATPAPAATGGAGAGLEGVAACESGGDPSAVSADGQYRGKYQFDRQTWESVGGSGDPAAAPEAVQDQLAAKLQAQRGSSPWPVCGG
ncbi:transglycosylase family protein [Patulibacter sp. SYSU D01012]|uniref:transglycosylase family protein n=1 Tax=Patulibacter sp. SYSU D01012 TaxID=2817381 RepID=UPI001B31174E|nr:transglycosylase family protein [Patulibacter sp. SYSU D01012]